MSGVRIRCTDSYGSVAYIHFRDGWRCTLASGTPAAFSYAGISDDQMAFVFALEDCDSPAEIMEVVHKYGSPRTKYELIMKGDLR